jgi:hypothetical protein
LFLELCEEWKAFAEEFKCEEGKVERLLSKWDDIMVEYTNDYLKKKFKFTYSYFPNLEDFLLLLRKGVFPYEWFDSPQKLKATALPSKSKFYSALRDSSISEEDYQHALKVWKQFKCETFSDYMLLYCNLDVLLLTDSLESYREDCMNDFQLDPLYYYTAPGLSLSAALSMTGSKPELLMDVNQYCFYDKTCGGLRGGYSGACTRKIKANNPYMGKDFDPSKPTTYICDLDMNNLYGYAMMQYLPKSNFHWGTDGTILNNPEEATKVILAMAPDQSIGRTLKVKISCDSRYWQDQQVDFPMITESKKVTYEQQSVYNKILIEDRVLSGEQIYMDGEDWKEGDEVKKTDTASSIKFHEDSKLLGDLKTKDEYIVHYRNLQFYLKHGWKLEKVYNYMEFEQEPWLKKYIEFNTMKRPQAKSNFVKDLKKLYNKSLFGKTMQDKRKHKDCRIATTKKRAAKLATMPQTNIGWP